MKKQKKTQKPSAKPVTQPKEKAEKSECSTEKKDAS